MNKAELSETLSGFYGMLKKHSDTLNPEDFIIIGGSSLVVQDILPEAYDVDLIAKFREKYDSVIDIADKEKLKIRIRPRKGDSEYQLAIDFAGQKFDIFYKGIEDVGLIDNACTEKKVPMNDIIICVRPLELIAKDYQKAIEGLEKNEIALELDSNLAKWRKYTERLRFLESHRTVAGL